MSLRIEVVAGGARTTIQDLGRPGWAHLGVPASGAADRRAYTLANRLVGNAEGAPALETTLSGPVLRFGAATTIALTGAPVEATLAGRSISMHAPIPVRAGQELDVGTATSGLRTYVAIRGGLAGETVLGSLSSDQLTGLGPAPLQSGDVLELGGDALSSPAVDIAPVAAATDPVVLPVTLGPREDWFAPDAVTAFLGATFTVTPQVDRIGVRVAGPQLPWRSDDSMRSEGLALGAVQVPPSGEAIVMLADHPTTGGYPVIAVVDEAALGDAAQLRPGGRVRFAVPRAAPRAPEDLEEASF
ncbi:MAG: biotin-dependent carboxyltransferase family protein [Solirubrobacteraceae bacterium]|nr:biotin-dependent carboxyltransferase family protein [Solirubrobacteraceae bacterium]